MEKRAMTLSMCAIITLGIVFYSCNKNDSSGNEVDNASCNHEMTTLMSELKTYDNTFEGRFIDRKIATRGFWDTAAVDVLGGAGGVKAGTVFGPWGAGILGLACAAASSYLYCHTLAFSTKIIQNSSNPYNEFGEVHNVMMIELDKSKSEFIVNNKVDTVKFVNKVCELIRYHGYSLNFVDKNVVYNVLNLVKKQCMTFDDASIDRAFNELIAVYPQSKADLTVMRDYTKSISKLAVSDIKAYANGYEKIVVNSSIAEQEKSQILVVTSIAKNSLAGWCGN